MLVGWFEAHTNGSLSVYCLPHWAVRGSVPTDDQSFLSSVTGISLVSVWYLQWNFYEIYVLFIWYFYSSSLPFLWYCYGICMGERGFKWQVPTDDQSLVSGGACLGTLRRFATLSGPSNQKGVLWYPMVFNTYWDFIVLNCAEQFMASKR